MKTNLISFDAVMSVLRTAYKNKNYGVVYYDLNSDELFAVEYSDSGTYFSSPECVFIWRYDSHVNGRPTRSLIESILLTFLELKNTQRG